MQYPTKQKGVFRDKAHPRLADSHEIDIIKLTRYAMHDRTDTTKVFQGRGSLGFQMVWNTG